jgi:hypothetical protein
MKNPERAALLSGERDVGCHYTSHQRGNPKHPRLQTQSIY